MNGMTRAVLADTGAGVLELQVPAEGKPFIGDTYCADHPLTRALHAFIDEHSINWSSDQGLDQCVGFLERSGARPGVEVVDVFLPGFCDACEHDYVFSGYLNTPLLRFICRTCLLEGSAVLERGWRCPAIDPSLFDKLLLHQDTRKLPIAGAKVLRLHTHHDDRGSFTETFSDKHCLSEGIGAEWVQDNHSVSRPNVLRGLHYQVGTGQAKLVRCIRGSILDVIVDLRQWSPTFRKWHSLALTENDQRVLYVPPGCAHGFLSGARGAEVQYKVSTPYDAASERSIRWDDPDLGITWIAENPVLLSERDRNAQTFNEALVAGFR